MVLAVAVVLMALSMLPGVGLGKEPLPVEAGGFIRFRTHCDVTEIGSRCKTSEEKTREKIGSEFIPHAPSCLQRMQEAMLAMEQQLRQTTAEHAHGYSLWDLLNEVRYNTIVPSSVKEKWIGVMRDCVQGTP